MRNCAAWRIRNGVCLGYLTDAEEAALQLQPTAQ